MQILKHLNKQVSVEYFFVKGLIEIDSDYFIRRIQEGFKDPNNMSNRTNVQDEMTPFQYFNNDPEFVKIINKFIDFIDKEYDLPTYHLYDSWGIKIGYRRWTSEHDHGGNILSGVIYLNSHPQTLDFNQINEKVKPEKGSFALFSPFLKHKCEKSNSIEPKWGISFNMARVVNW